MAIYSGQTRLRHENLPADIEDLTIDDLVVPEEILRAERRAFLPGAIVCLCAMLLGVFVAMFLLSTWGNAMK